MLQLPNPECVIALGNGRYAARVAGNNCRMSWGKFKDLDQGSYDVVYAYLAPAAMGDLWTKARREVRAGTLLISNSFGIPVVPTLVDGSNRREGRLDAAVMANVNGRP